MICLEGNTNNKIEICEALLRRAYFHTEQYQYIDELRKRLMKGSEGEYQLKWFWQDMAFSDPHLLFFNFETIRFERFKYQMDAIFICERFILILECKHIAGEIYYDEATHQLWREYNGQKLVLNDPFSQVMRHEEWITNKQFRSFFNIHNEDVANKMLKRLGFKIEGKTKSRKYLISEDIWLNNRRDLYWNLSEFRD